MKSKARASMRKTVVLLVIAFISISWKADKLPIQRPCIAFSFDDGNSDDILNYKGADWNRMIVDQLKKQHIHSVWFVCAQGVDSKEGKLLLRNWDQSGNLIANHTYTHPEYNDPKMTCAGLVKEIHRCNVLIDKYKNYQKIFRFPYLHAGNTTAKRDSVRAWFKQNGYRQGWVTIDASDWYINSRMITRLKANPRADIKGFREYYINHIFDRALYYNKLSLEINHRQVKHTVLLHFNLTSALFLTDLIEKFKREGWDIASYSDAIKDPAYKELPVEMPAEQSLIWALAKQSGRFEKQLRYPGEDGSYEKDKMDRLGL
jgi:peptidoglycan/xylan/chitin deacetylase (PgdA/CDA1 family)